MATVLWTILYALGMAAIGARLILFIPLGIFGAIIERTAKTEEGEFLAVSLFVWVGSFAVTLALGIIIGLPWYAALIAGVLVGITSFAKPNPNRV
jgi:hypothetical protein